VKAAISLPLLVNGDIETPDEARAALEASGADGVMIGRAALGRPWLVGEIARALEGWERTSIEPALMAEAAILHYRGLLKAFGMQQGLRHARKHIAAYADEAARRGAVIAPEKRAQILISEDCEAVIGFLQEAFLRIPAQDFSGQEAA
jgi:tRNA-dihydrouridine synthase